LRIIVDANIVFSGILNTKSKIGDLLINSYKHIEFIAPDFLRVELRKNYPKLSSISKLSSEQITDLEFQVCNDIQFLSEEQISPENWKTSYEIVKDIDEKDTIYIAFSKQFNCKIWSGDKKLILGLAKKGFDNFISTDELLNIRVKSQKLKSRSYLKRKR
jgi:predicted nucleic acid-binding protein